MALRLEEIPKIILTPTLEAGGDLPDATTYYFIGWFAHGVGYYGGAFGEASDQISITTTAPNQRIRIDMSFVYNSVTYSGPTAWSDFLSIFPDSIPSNTTHRWSWMLKWDYYSMLDGSSVPYKWCNLNDPAISDEFQDDSYGHRRWCQVYYGGGARDYYWNIDLTALNPDRDYGVFNHSQLAWRYDNYNVHTNLNMDKSDLVLIVEDDATTYTQTHLINALEAAPAEFQDRFSLSLGNTWSETNSFNLTIKGATIGPGVLELSFMSINTISVTQNHCPNVTYRNCYIGDNMFTQNFWVNPYGSFIDTVWYHAGNAFILDSITLADNFAPWCRSGLTHYQEIDGFFSNGTPQHQWRYFKPTMPITNSTFKNTYIGATANSVTHDYTGVNAITWRDVSFLDPAQIYDILFQYSYIGPGETGYDEINAYNLIVDRPDGLLRARFSNMEGGDGADCVVNVFQDIHFLIKDKDGVAIQGADILITNNDGEVFSGTTDQFGECTISPQTYKVQWDAADSDGYGNDSMTTNQNPLRIVIGAAGYLNYEGVSTISGETNMDIALIDEELIPDDGLTNLYEREAARHLFLNEAIPNIGDANGLQPSLTEGSLYVALLTASPGEQGSQANEAAYPGYARAAVARVTGWTELNGEILNSGQVNFPECAGASTEEITHYALMKEASGGDMVAYGTLDELFTIYDTAQPQFGPFSLKFKMK